jgi:DNA-binding ferritin-like protein
MSSARALIGSDSSSRIAGLVAARARRRAAEASISAASASILPHRATRQRRQRPAADRSHGWIRDPALAQLAQARIGEGRLAEGMEASFMGTAHHSRASIVGIGTIHFQVLAVTANVGSSHRSIPKEGAPHGHRSIGIAKKDREAVAKHLSKLLADTYSLYLKTHSFHWNVTGPQFNSLHAMFECQYNELWLAADEVAERIRTLDVFAPGSYSQFGKLTSIKEEAGVPEWKEMVPSWSKATKSPRIPPAKPSRPPTARATKAPPTWSPAA